VNTIFFGSYPLSAACLAAMAREDIKPVAVFTTRLEYNAPVREWCIDSGLVPVFCNLNTKQIIEILGNLDIPLETLVCVSYPKLISAEIRTMFNTSCINLHTSCLPQYRGPDPIRRAVLAGESSIGITIHEMEDRFDSGDIIAQDTISIMTCKDLGEIIDSISKRAPEILISTLRSLPNLLRKKQKQNEAEASYAHTCTESDRIVRHDTTSCEIYLMLKAFRPFHDLIFITDRGSVSTSDIMFEPPSDTSEYIEFLLADSQCWIRPQPIISP